MTKQEEYFEKREKEQREARRNSEEWQHRIKAEAEVLSVLAANKCTVVDAITILSKAKDVIMQSATVPEKDYLQELSERWL